MDTGIVNVHQELIDKCRDYDRGAQYKLYRLYYKAMYNASLRIVGDEMEAEDIMQEAFLSAFRNIDSYSGEVSFGAWLKRIVLNRSIDILKRKKIEFTEEDVADKIIEEDKEDNDKKYEVERIKKAMNSLAEGYRIVLSLYLLEGYDHEEIGQILGVSASTSRSQYTRARKKLLEILS